MISCLTGDIVMIKTKIVEIFFTKRKQFKIWHFVWIAIVLSELFTAFANTIQSFILYGTFSRTLLMAGAIDSLFVPLIVAPIVLYFTTYTAELKRTNEQLQQEISNRKHAEQIVLERTQELESSNEKLRREMAERQRAEQEVTKTARHFQSLIESGLDIITVLNSDGSIRYESPSVKRVLGYEPEELIGLSAFDYIHPSDRAATREVFTTAVKEPGRHDSIELRFRHKDGSWRSFETVGKSLLTDDGGVTVIVNSRDITDRKRMEEDLIRAQKLESLGILAGGIAHDFNNLLVSILGNISLALLDAVPASETHRQLQTAEKASLRAQSLTQQLLTFSRGGDPVKKVIDIGPVIREATELSLRGARVTCAIDLPEDLWPIEADAGQIAQVVNNLVINADQAMPAGGTITVRVEKIDSARSEIPMLKPGRYIRLSVHDSGIGIPEEYLGKVFDPYYTTKQKGSGLGLAVTYSIIRRHDGHITVESTPGTGTTFTVYLPAGTAACAEVQAGEKRITEGRGMILVMDDELDVRETLGKMLRRLGYMVEFVEDGAKAVERYRESIQNKRPFDAVIMDLTVPGGMGGRDALARLRDIDPGVRAIVSSGYSNDPILADYAKYGFAGAVAKPFLLKELSVSIAAVLKPSSDKSRLS
jgi:two-component system cell cycle sensor histidine kinase/response regulator CckA